MRSSLTVLFQELLVEEGRMKNQKIETKCFPFCFSKTGLKTIVSYEEERCPKLADGTKRWQKMIKDEY
jgi:hypothetical protein